MTITRQQPESEIPHQSLSLEALANGLGYAGAIPFAGLAYLVLFPDRNPLTGIAPTILAHGLLSYGAVILSFLGGLHWGRAVDVKTQISSFDPRGALIWSVSLSLIAWGSTFAASMVAASILIAGLFIALWADIWLFAKNYWPAWMRRLRLHLSLIAIASLSCLYV